jgi:hypothetical protein
VGATEPLFIGATLAHVGRLQTCFRASFEDSPEEARAILAVLEKIRLPPQYQYTRGVRRERRR